jgi:hypothetical protein
MKLTEEQINGVINWMNKWEQLKGTAIPIRFKEDFTEQLPKAIVSGSACPNCKEEKEWCACMRNTCHKCGKPVGNITFTVCDECWDKDK